MVNNSKMNGFVFDKGIDITPVQSPMGFTYGAGVLVRRSRFAGWKIYGLVCVILNARDRSRFTRSLWMSAKKNIVRC